MPVPSCEVEPLFDCHYALPNPDPPTKAESAIIVRMAREQLIATMEVTGSSGVCRNTGLYLIPMTILWIISSDNP